MIVVSVWFDESYLNKPQIFISKYDLKVQFFFDPLQF